MQLYTMSFWSSQCVGHSNMLTYSGSTQLKQHTLLILKNIFSHCSSLANHRLYPRQDMSRLQNIQLRRLDIVIFTSHCKSKIAHGNQVYYHLCVVRYLVCIIEYRAPSRCIHDPTFPHSRGDLKLQFSFLYT